MKPAAEKGSNVVPHLDLAYTVDNHCCTSVSPCLVRVTQAFDYHPCILHPGCKASMASASDAWAAKMSLEDLAKGVKATADMAGLELALDTSFLSREALLQAIQDCCSGLHPIPISS